MAVLAAFLRLGKKYEIPQLYAESVARLSREFPSSLAKWEKDRDQNLEIEESPTLAFDVINLAKETGLLSIIPTAFYYYCEGHLNIKGVFDGIERLDGSVAILRPEDQRACIMGWHQLVEAQARETFGWLNPDAHPLACVTQTRCNMARRSHFFNLFRFRSKCLALEPWDSGWEDELCHFCKTTSQNQHKRGRKKMWELLPSFFSLPEWEALLKD
jgi:hypothetical protein